MQGGQQFHPKKATLPHTSQVGNVYIHNGRPSVVLPPSTKLLSSFHGMEFQPNEVCPKNFIIFDQTDNRSQIMFNPAISHQINYPGFDIHPMPIPHSYERNNKNNEELEKSSPLMEDSEDIDALLSFDEEEYDDVDDDGEEVSTAHTQRNCGATSPDLCSTASSKPRKNRHSSYAMISASSEGSCSSDRTRQKLKKMVKVLQGIVPGGNEMNTVTVLDEAVKYLKTLKVEVQNHGMEDLEC